jgi:hypothetical protein
MSRWVKLQEAVERVTGVAFRPLADVTQLEETAVEYRGKVRELQDLAYTVMDYVQGQPQDMKAVERRKLAQKARIIHQTDPQYGGTVNLLNEFTLGRGIPKPQANDEEVQEVVIDEFWDDVDNKRVITTHAAQVRFNTALSIQSNVFPLVYDDGDDGKVKLGLLDHDSVEEAVRDPDNRLRILYYFTKSFKRVWDVENHCYQVSKQRELLRYYEEFRNLRDARDEAERGAKREEPLPVIPDALIGRGRVLHVSINRTDEQAFGIPEIARTVRWLTAYNDLMRARVDMAKAAASIIMRRKLRGGAAGAQQLTAQAMLSSGASATTVSSVDQLGRGPKPGSILEENDLVEHQSFNLNSGSQGAMQDAQMIRSQYSVATGWPQSYLGDPSGTPMATATSLELRVLKMVETRQQVLEDVLRALIDHAIERAIETGKLSKFRPMTDEERERANAKREEDNRAYSTPMAQAELNTVAGTTADEDEPPEGMVLRDLTYQISMPSPLRRAMGDLVNAIANIAKTFDPNNTNMDLSRLLLGIALGEALEVEDPGAAVERIFPEGYVDPAVAAAAAPPELAPGDFEAVPPPVAPNGQRPTSPDNPYGVPMKSRPPEEVMQQAAADAIADLRLVTLHTRSGEPMPAQVQEAVVNRLRGDSRPQILTPDRGEQSDVLADELLGPAVRTALGLLNS